MCVLFANECVIEDFSQKLSALVNKLFFQIKKCFRMFYTTFQH